MFKIIRKPKPDKDLGQIQFKLNNELIFAQSPKSFTPKYLYSIRDALADKYKCLPSQIEITMPKGFILYPELLSYSIIIMSFDTGNPIKGKIFNNYINQ